VHSHGWWAPQDPHHFSVHLDVVGAIAGKATSVVLVAAGSHCFTRPIKAVPQQEMLLEKAASFLKWQKDVRHDNSTDKPTKELHEEPRSPQAEHTGSDGISSASS
jgi:hypothetical protein